MVLVDLFPGGLVFFLLFLATASGRVLTTEATSENSESNNSTAQQPSEDVPEPSYFLSYVHQPSSREAAIHQISKNLLEVTQELVSFGPRSGDINMTVQNRLAELRNLPPSEVAELLAAHGVLVPRRTAITCDFNSPFYRSMDGSCNNLEHPCWGKSGEPYQRWLPPVYADGVNEMRRRADGGPLPSPRQVYQWLVSQTQQGPNTTYPTLSNLAVFWGQMMAHEIVLTPGVTVKIIKGKKFEDIAPNCCSPNTRHPECMPIVMDYEDGFYERGHCLAIVRSAAYAYSPFSCTPLSLGQHREQMNHLTAFIDASLVYGSSEEEMRKLREHGGTGAKLAMDYSTGWSYPPRKDRPCKAGQSVCDKRCFHAGERRANENPFLAALHTLWDREHNRLVDALRIRRWPEETLFHVVRKIVGALMQHITYKEYLPRILGEELTDILQLSVPTKNYRYDPNLNPTIYNVFATAAFRYGHSMLAERYQRVGRSPGTSPLLSGDFFSMDDYCSPHGDPVASLLSAQAHQRAQRVDNLFSRQVTNHLFAKKMNDPGLDLFSINVQRGRDHGLPPYTKWREVCGLPKVNDYSDLRHYLPEHVIDRLAAVYGPGGVHEIDLFAAGISEFPVNGGLMGPTFTCVVSHQFKLLKFGDRFWYENTHNPGKFSNEQIASIQKTTLASMLCRNSDVREIHRNIFEVESPSNPRVPCSVILHETDLDVNLWP
ncbi:Peroxidasin [Araneus ventricosus]|uniref:Peroxidasin n=1 Tax=Araneus ventricosus TaxID=182803 RepID=A0A4Y2JGW5_ARAVE|nr:Peroxidasin [Araneus ventricosus]